MAQRSSDLRKAGNVVCLQPVSVQRTPRGRGPALSLLAPAVVGAALIASAIISLISSFTPGTPVGLPGFDLQRCLGILHLPTLPRGIANTSVLAGPTAVLDVLPQSGPWATKSSAIFSDALGNHFGTASAPAARLIAAAFVPLFLTARVSGERAALRI